MSHGVDPSRPLLEYGRPAPWRQRLVAWLASQPWPSWWTYCCAMLLALCATLLWQAREPWQAVYTIFNGYGTLDEKISRDGALLLTHSGDRGYGRGDPVVWDVAAGRQRFVLRGAEERAPIWASFSPDDRRILGADDQRRLYLWDATSGALLAQLPTPQWLPGSTAQPRQAFFSPDGRRIVVADNRQAELFDAADGSKVAVLLTQERDHDQVTGPVVFSPDGRLCSVGTNTLTPSVFSSELVAKMHNPNLGSTGGARVMGFSADGKTIAANIGGYIGCWDARTGAMRWPPVRIGSAVFRQLCFAPPAGGDGGGGGDSGGGASPPRLITLQSPAQGPDTLTVVDAAAGTVVRTIPIGAHGRRFIFSRDGRVMLVESFGKLQSFDAATFTLLGTVATQMPGYSWSPISSDGSRIAVPSQSLPRRILLYDRTLTEARSHLPEPDRGQYGDVTFAAPGEGAGEGAGEGTGDRLVTVTDRGTTQFWRLRRPEPPWGIIALWQCWLTILSLLLLAASYVRDLVVWGRSHRSRTIAV